MSAAACTVCLHHGDPAPEGNLVCCAFCGARLSPPGSRTIDAVYAYWIASFLLLTIAYSQPFMTVYRFGTGQSDTMLGGILRLADSGAVGVAAIVFIASILVPVIKLVVLGLLLLRAHAKLQFPPLAAQRLHRMISWSGRWSMLDMFVIFLLVSLLDLSGISQVEPEAGAWAFGVAVITTMLAARAFQSRLIWRKEA